MRPFLPLRSLPLRLLPLLLVLAAVLATGGCSTVRYYAHTAGGHLDLMSRARPISEWLEDEHTPRPLRERLELAKRMRQFAVDELKLPDNPSYRRYADLQRAAAVWNVVATPELSLKLETSCFPLVGCVGYRGYFDRSLAEAAATPLRERGLDVFVYGVPAYSTLGWMNWLGGDPLLSTFIYFQEGELARLIFHELAHQVAYAKDDTVFNESFATTVERIGSQRWLAECAQPAARQAQAAADVRRADFHELTRAARDQLARLYASPVSDEQKRERKAEILAEMRQEHERLKRERWGGRSPYDRWFERANNAALAVVAAYNQDVPALERLYERTGRNLPRFYSEVKRLAALPKPERQAALDAQSR